MNKYSIILYFLISFFFSCSTNKKFAEQSLGFKLPKNLKLINYKKEFYNNPSGNGTHFLEYEFSSIDEKYLKDSCVKYGFLSLPVDNSKISDMAIFQWINEKESNGYYKVENNDFNKISYTICVVSFNSKKIYIYRTLY